MSESGLGVVSIAKRSAQALDDGTLTQETYAKLQERCAQEMFPNDSIGVALGKFFATPHGAQMLNHGLKKSYRDMQLRTALGNGVRKEGDIPHQHREQPTDDGDDDDPDRELEKLGEAYRAAHPEANFTRAQAIAHVMQHDPDGQRLLQQSKEKSLANYMR